MIVKRGADGRLVRVGDVARVELGAQSYAWEAKLDGRPATLIGLYQLPGSNALEAKQGVVDAMEELAERFPEGLEYSIPYDTTEYISASIAEVVGSLLIAIVLVVLTVYIFLQDLRTTLVPAITIPVSLIGTFAVMLALGQSINNLTLFGLVLAIGIVVDDAIVVVENTMRLIDEEGLEAREAVSKAMGEIGGAIVATTLVLLAVFAPTLAIPGLTGRMYRPFAITISVATIFSSVNALTLSPALCGLLLRPSPKERALPFRLFNRMFEWGTGRYMGVVNAVVRKLALVSIAFAGVLAALGWGFTKVPGGFVPPEDQGYILLNAQLPNGASLERTRDVMEEALEIISAHPEVRSVASVNGYSLLEGVQGPNYAFAMINLTNWSERPEKSQAAWGLAARLLPELSTIQEGIVFGFLPPTISGLGAAGGFQLELQDRGGLGLNALEQISLDVVGRGEQSPVLTRLNQNLRAGVPQLYLEVDREKCKRLGIPLSEVFTTLQANLGSSYVNDFNLFGRTWRVMAQADEPTFAQSRPGTLNGLEVRTATRGGWCRWSTLDRPCAESRRAPSVINRFNMFPLGDDYRRSQRPASVRAKRSTRSRSIVQGASTPPQMGYSSGPVLRSSRRKQATWRP